MRKIGLWLKIVISLLLGFLWSYSLLTRTGLFALIPLWLKVVFWGISSINFSLLSFCFIHFWKQSFKNKHLVFYVITISIILTALVFILTPYQRLPFRTSHTLIIQTSDSQAEIAAVYSPDKNLIDPNDFRLEENAQIIDESGFKLNNNSKIIYSNSFIGGLTIAFVEASGPITIIWDDESFNFIPDQITRDEKTIPDEWVIVNNPETKLIELSLPGNTWGNPDLLWSILGTLMPIADFVSCVSLLIAIYWTGKLLINKGFNFSGSKQCIYAWIGFLVAILLVRFGIYVLLPDITSWLSIFIYLPPAFYLLYGQISFILKYKKIKTSTFKKLESTIEKVPSSIKKINQKKYIVWISLFIIASIGMVNLYQLTQPGMGVSGDSVHYMDGAKNLVNELRYVRKIEVGTSQPITGFPPGLPALLIPGILIGFSAETSARILNLLSYFFFIILSGGIVFTFTKRALPAILISSLTVMFVPMESIFGWVMSEPAFISLSLVLVVLCYLYIRKPKTWLFILMAILSGFIILVRLAGLSLVAAIALVLLFHKQEKTLKRLGTAVLFGIISLLPTILFLIRNSLVANSISESRGINWAVFKPEYWEIIINEISSWLKIDSIFKSEIGMQLTFGIVFIGIFLFYLFIRIKYRKSEQYKQVFIVLDLFSILSILYLVMIVLNVIIFTPLQTVPGLRRYTLPLYPIFMIFSAIIFAKFIWPGSPYPIKIIISIILMMILRLYIFDYGNFNNNVPTNFRAYTDIISNCSDNLDVFYNLPENAEIYSNNCEFIYYASGLSCNHLPLDSESYNEGSELFKAIQDGNIVAVMNDYGSTPSNINRLIQHLDIIDYQCMITFYEWQQE